MNEKNDFLATEPISNLILKLTIPTIAAQIINMLYNIVDRIYIGHIPKAGALALTGVGVCMPLIMIISAFSALICYGGAPRASIFMGKKDKESAEKTLNNCFLLLIITSIILTFLLFKFNRNILLAFGASDNTIKFATDYMNIYAFGTIFVQLTLGLNAFITAQGFTKVSMTSVLTGSIVNIILDPVFIFGFNMGVKGAAIATVLSQTISCLWVLRFLIGGKTILKLKSSYFKLEKKIILPAIALGLSTFIMQTSESIISICFNSSLLKYGGDIAVGTMTILSSVMQFAFLPLSGIGQGTQPIISYNYGAGKSQRVKEAFFKLVKISFIYSVLLWCFIMLFPKIVMSIFTSDLTLIEFGIKPLRIYTASLGLFGIQIACQYTFNALGNAKSSIIVAVMRKFILLIPLIFILPNIITSNKTYAVYLSEPIADFISVLFTVLLFKYQFKKVDKC